MPDLIMTDAPRFVESLLTLHRRFAKSNMNLRVGSNRSGLTAEITEIAKEYGREFMKRDRFLAVLLFLDLLLDLLLIFSLRTRRSPRFVSDSGSLTRLDFAILLSLFSEWSPSSPIPSLSSTR